VFEYFPNNYGWSLAVMIAISMGGQISEIDDICGPLRAVADETTAESTEAWARGWRTMAERLERLARADEDAGHLLTASRKYLRSATYHLIGERAVPSRDSRKLDMYKQGIEVFRTGVELSEERTEFVDVPYQGTSLPSLFLPAEGAVGSSPCVIHFDGLDVNKEIIYLMHARDLTRRGVSMLICDHPGVGGALRLRGLPTRFDIEVAASACVDYLESRPDVDAQRIGIMALSMGGYYAPRAAAMEKRLRCCVLWGASWSVEAAINAMTAGGTASVPLDTQFAWVLGTDDPDELDVKLKQFTLEGVADKIECPILIQHGENDRQVPLWTAQKTFDSATASSRRELRIFSLEEGGAEHCNLDNVTMATDYMYDWIADVFETGAGNPTDQECSARPAARR
jgi:dienelactone hydrolase